MKSGCVDEANGATDKFSTGCDYYKDSTYACGIFDDDDFKANSMCCACKPSGNF